MSQRFMAAAHFLRAGSIWMASAKCSRHNCQERPVYNPPVHRQHTALTLWTLVREKPHLC